MTNWDDAFDNSSYIPDAEGYMRTWTDAAAAYRTQADFAELDISYGPHEREIFDLFRPDGTPKGLAVFVHGGYWMQLDKSYWSHLAEGARKNGWAVCIPSYTLAPDARISEITQQIGRAITHAAAMIPGPICLSGHSAGGHLVARMNCANAPLRPQITKRIQHTLSISGVHDLRDLLKTKMNETLKLSPDEAKSESPALLPPRTNIKITNWVGGEERPQFIHQANFLTKCWQHANTTIDKNLHHFNVIEALASPKSPITKCFIEIDQAVIDCGGG